MVKKGSTKIKASESALLKDAGTALLFLLILTYSMAGANARFREMIHVSRIMKKRFLRRQESLLIFLLEVLCSFPDCHFFP
jgi:hypothetical protein